MKLNGLSNNLGGTDKSLSNSYLSHIVELLRTEVANLTVKESELEAITTEHIETQKTVVDTKTVNAEKVNTASINDKIILTSVINVLADLKVGGKDVLTEGVFEGPFTYKGVTEVLPVDANSGDVYITDDKVNIFNGTTWDEFILPVGTVSLAEYNKDKAEILTEISNVQSDLNSTKEDLVSTKSTLNEAVIDIADINAKLTTKVDEAPKDDNAYVRKNGEWVEQTSADNTVKSIAGESTIENTTEGVKINSPKVDITTVDFKINGSYLPEVDKLALTKTTEIDTEYHYEMKFGRSPFDATSSIRPAYCGYGDSFHTMLKAAPEQFTVFTKNWQYTKWSSSLTGADNGAIHITAMDKDGNISLIPNNYIDWISSSTVYMQATCFVTFNQEYVPEGYEDTVYLFCPGTANTNGQKTYLLELKDGKFSRKISYANLVSQGYTPALFQPQYSAHVGLIGGKGLRNKNIQRICMVCYDTANIGGTWAIIIGGDKSSKPTDPFNPNKYIYVKLPTTAYYGYACMASTDSAWYLQENGTGRLMRITPNGQVTELNLTDTVVSCAYNYIEYTDKNGKPAVAYYVQKNASGGKHYVIFVEEGDNGEVKLTERVLPSTVVTGSAWYAQQFKFIENTHYIFFTADCGASPNGTVNFGTATAKNVVFYFDKKTLTMGALQNFYKGLTFGVNDFIEMHKTKDGTIWFPYVRQDPAGNNGQINWIDDVDYTEIEDGVDNGVVDFHVSYLGTANNFFTASTTQTKSNLCYTHNLQGDPSWESACTRIQLSATNDDGILCLISGDLKSMALCWGNGNVKVYPVGSPSGIYDTYASNEPYLPDEPYFGNSWTGQPTLYGMSHGWVLEVKSIADGTTLNSATPQNASYTYIGLNYKNGQPNLVSKPYLTKIMRCGACYNPQRIKFEKYSYLQTYDDYERRQKVLGGIRAAIGYGNAATGCDGYFKEVRKETEKLNLTYNGKVISSVDD